MRRRTFFGNLTALGASPFLAFAMLIGMISLAGVPFTAGFFGKFYVFSSALQVGSSRLELLWLVILALGMSAVSLYYYLQVLKRVFVSDVPFGQEAIEVPPIRLVPLIIAAVATVVLGCAPAWLIVKP